MLLECAGCGKMYRVREGSTSPPTTCPACKGSLRPAGAPAAPPPPGADPKVKELESRLEAGEKELGEAQAEVQRLRGELDKSQMSSRDTGKRDTEIREKVSKIAALEREVQDARGRAQQAGLASLKEKDSEIHYLKERVAALEGELEQGKGAAPKGETVPLADLEKALQDKETEHRESQEAIARMGDDFKRAQDAHIAAIKAKDDEIGQAHQKIAFAEEQLSEANARAKGAPPPKPDAALERAQSRIAQLEKIVQDGERRYRESQAQYDKASAAASGAGAASEALEEKDRKAAELQKQLENRRDVEVVLRRQIGELQAAFQAEKSARKTVSAPPPPPRETVLRPKRLGELKYLAVDLDKNLGSISSALSGLVERVRRLQEAVQQTEDEVSQAEAAAAAAAPAPAPEPSPYEEAPEAEAPSEDSPAEEPAPEGGEEVARLESLPAPEVEPAELPADETMLDKGGVDKSKARAKIRPKRGQKPPPEPSAEGEAPLEEEPLSAETSPGPLPEEEGTAEPEPPKKKGLFSKLFGKKK